MPRSYTIVALALPLLAVGLGIVRAELFGASSRDFVFEIGGYDPRDLLRGHYLQFRLVVDPEAVREPCDDALHDCCLCLTRLAPDAVVHTERATCATARASCDGALYTSYLDQVHRYYVPEAQARELERRLIEAAQTRTAHAVFSIDEQGVARVRELRLDGEAIPGSLAPLGR